MGTIVTNRRISGSIEMKSSLSFLKPITNSFIKLIQSNYNYPDDKLIGLSLVFSEIVLNAIQHGNKDNFNKNVLISYTLSEEKIKISVEDEGTGFDYSALADYESNKGLALINLIANNVYWNTKGNKINLEIEVD